MTESPDPIAPTPERMEKRDGVDLDQLVAHEEAGSRPAKVRWPDPLDRYHARGELARGDKAENDRRYAAGCQLREDHHRAAIVAPVTGAYGEPVGNIKAHVRALLGSIDARKRYDAAVRAVTHATANEVIDVCCLGYPAGCRIRMEILRRGLALLADHYGLQDGG